MGMTKDVFDEYGNYKYPDYANTQYTNYATTTGGKLGMNNRELLYEANRIMIDNAIEIINHYLDYPKEEVRKALLVAIDTMRKYQKIEEIVGRYGFESSWLCLRKIRDVLEGDEE